MSKPEISEELEGSEVESEPSAVPFTVLLATIFKDPSLRILLIFAFIVPLTTGIWGWHNPITRETLADHNGSYIASSTGVVHFFSEYSYYFMAFTTRIIPIVFFILGPASLILSAELIHKSDDQKGRRVAYSFPILFILVQVVIVVTVVII